MKNVKHKDNWYFTRYPFPILMKVEFSRHIFEKYSNFDFYEYPPIGS
jgi:hypothetical protein